MTIEQDGPRHPLGSGGLSRRRLIQQAGSFALGSTFLAACGGSDDEAATTAAGGSSSTPATSAASTAATSEASSTAAETSSTAAALAEQTLEVWDFSEADTPYAKAATALDKAFMAANPGVTIKRTAYPYSQYFTLIRTAMTRKKGPDVLSMYGAQFGDEYRRALRPLDDLLTDEQKTNLLYLDDMRTGDQLLCMPYTTYATSFRYNKELFSKAGLDPETPPATWDEFLAACDKLKASGVTPLAAGFKDGYHGEAWTFALTSQTLTLDEIHANYRREQPWKSEGYLTAVNYLADLGKRGYFTENSQDIISSEFSRQFLTKKAGLMLTANTDEAEIVKAIGKDNVGVMRLPSVTESKYDDQFLNASYNLGWSISTWTEKEEAAAAYINYLVAAPQQEELFKLSGILPNNRAADVSSPDATTQQLLDWIKNDPLLHFGVAYGAQEEAVFDRRIPQIVTGKFSTDKLADELEAIRVQLGPVKAS